MRGRLAGRVVLDGVFASPRLLDAAGLALRAYGRVGLGRAARKVGVFRALPQRLDEMEALLPPTQPYRPLPPVTPALGEQVARVGMIGGCVMKQVFSGTNAVTARVLATNGCDVLTPPSQGCCGALHAHAGRRETARQLARRMIDLFPDTLDAVVVNAAGCGSMLKEYGHLLADDPAYAQRAVAFAGRVRDITEWLDEIGLRPPSVRVETRVTYQDACHLRHAQGIRLQPRRLLRMIPGLELVEMAGADDCCGSAGIYNITQPDLAMRLLDQKMDRVAATGARVVAAANPGCIIQLAYGARRRGMRLTVAHPIDLLDRAYHASSGTIVPD
jgi:glycolate oxidase iron-sulfur subunit